MKPFNLLENLPRDATEEVFETLVSRPGVHVEHIVSNGQASPAGFWYDSDSAECVLLLQGNATLRFDDPVRLVDLRPGDWLEIPAHTRHRVERTSELEPTVWLAIHFETKS